MLRRTRKEKRKSPPSAIQVIEGDKAITVSILGTVGTHLSVKYPTGVRLISAAQCTDPEAFRSAWNALNPHQFYWDDGTPASNFLP